MYFYIWIKLIEIATLLYIKIDSLEYITSSSFYKNYLFILIVSEDVFFFTKISNDTNNSIVKFTLFYLFTIEYKQQ